MESIISRQPDVFHLMALSAGVIQGLSNIGGVYTDFSPTSYDSTIHRFWRIRESAGSFYWETSADGLSFYTHGFIANPIALYEVYIGINAGRWDPLADPGVARVDSFSILP